jgi:hypothetical protein
MSKITQVAVGFHSFGTCPTQFAVSLSGVVRYEGTKITSMINVPSPYVAEARNKIVKRFLTQTHASHLWMVDVDLEFPEDALNVTLQDMASMDAEIMFGTYALGDFRPSIFAQPGPDGHLPTVSLNLDGGQCYEIFAGSTGWLLMTREAAQKVWDANKDKHWPWFDHDVEEGGELGAQTELNQPDSTTIRIGEDFTFSKRARDAGFKLYGTTRPLLIHVKYQPLLNGFHEEMAKARGLSINPHEKLTDEMQKMHEEKKNELAKGSSEGGSGSVVKPGADREGSEGGEGTSGEDQG